jgi:hypothetical protein
MPAPSSGAAAHANTMMTKDLSITTLPRIPHRHRTDRPQPGSATPCGPACPLGPHNHCNATPAPLHPEIVRLLKQC